MYSIYVFGKFDNVTKVFKFKTVNEYDVILSLYQTN